MLQVLRLSGLALVASVLLSFLVLIGLFFANFVVQEWEPGWNIVRSLLEWLPHDSLPSAADVAARPVPPWDRLWPWGAAALAPLVWYLGAWWMWGRDRRLGVEFPRFRPPEGLSPAGVRQILDMGFDAKCIAAEMLSLAVRGHLRMHYGDAAHLRVAMETFREKLEHELEGPVYETHLWAVALGAMISGLGFMAAASQPGGFPAGLDFWLATSALIAMATLNVLFFRLMKAPTDLGRQILEEIGGFRRFLATAEHERMKLADAPRMTSHLFAQHLPYALAMDIELDWSERFAASLKRTIPDALDYDWYADPGKVAYDMGLMGMVRALGGAMASVLESGAK
jgi:hypothetical protein